MNARKVELASRLNTVKAEIAAAAKDAGRSLDEITLIVVTKTFPVTDAEILYELGERNFGENRDQEGSAKSPILPDDVIWHFQGQIQSKKIKSIVQWADVVHSLDDGEHAAKFNNFPPRDYFIQVSLDSAATHRGGVPITEVESFYRGLSGLDNLRICGLMVVPPLEMEPQKAFLQVTKLARELELPHLSMGMSGDFREAIGAGATHIRVGSSILGSRTLPA